MKLKWYGHASFRLTSAAGVSIITDPYDPATAGYAPYREPCDIVIMSSDNDRFHCNTQLVPGPHTTINALTLARTGRAGVEKGIVFRAIEAMEANDHPEHDPDQNGMYKCSIDGVTIGHMGDMGNALSPAQIAFFRDVDVLLALVGGLPTIKLPDLKLALDQIKPKLIVPMHFRTLTYRPRNTLWIESFLADFDVADVDFACDCEVELVPDALPLATRVLVLDHAR
jgi:L-ascorbate metabolism protein UlaG (beta-lactamase superfamily)